MEIFKNKNILRKQKKGSTVQDGLMVIIVMFTVVLFIFIGKMVFTDLNDDLQDSTELSNSTKELSQNVYDKYDNVFDGIFLMVFILLWIMLLVAAFMLDSHPAFFVVSVLLLVAVFIVAGFISNAYDDFVSDDTFSVVSQGFPMTNAIMSNLLVVIIVVTFSVLLVLYGKSRT